MAGKGPYVSDFGRAKESRTIQVFYKIQCNDTACNKCTKLQRFNEPYCTLFGRELIKHGSNFKRLEDCILGEVR